MGKNKKAQKNVDSDQGGKLSAPVITSHEFEGLLGFEELPPCKVKKLNKRGKIIKQKKLKKQSSSPINEEKKQNNKKKKKKKAKKITEKSDSIQDMNDEKAEEENTKSEEKAQKTRKSLKKKRKQLQDPEFVPSKKKKYDNTSYQGVGQTNEKVDVSEWDAIFVPPPVRDALAELGFSQPTEIQRLVLPAAIKGHKDIIGAAETGSGKTLAFAIPIIHGILEDKHREALESIPDSGVEQSDDEEEMEGEETEKIETISAEDSDEESQEIDSEDNEETEDVDENLESDEENEDEMDGSEMHDDSDENSDSDTKSDNGLDNGELDTGLGCVKVIDDIEFDFLDDDEKPKSKSINKLRALIVTPTRELAIQVNSHISAVLKYTGLTSVVVVGGVAAQKQERLLRHGPDIVIGTPGRLWELIQENNGHLSQVSLVKYLAIDETDRMVERGHFQELMQLLEMINNNSAAKEKRQTFIFSATLSTVHDAPKRLKIKQNAVKMTSEVKIEQLAQVIGIKKNRKVVDVTRTFGTAASLTEARINCLKDEKDFYLYYFLKSYPGRTLVFCNSIDCVRRLQNLFTLLQCHPQSLHASLQQKQRLKSLERFSSNPRALLLATDVAARGLDIPNIQHVIHYQVPRTAETYVHRSGRTARARKEGLSVLLIESAEVKKYKQLCNTLNRSSDIPPFPIDQNIMGQVKQRVRFARTVEKIEHKQRKSNAESDWFKKAAKEAELFIEEDEYDDDVERERSMQSAREKRELKEKHFTLLQMLSKPLLSSNFSGKYPTHTGSVIMPFNPLSVAENNTVNALSAVKKESREYSKLLKSVKIKPPVQKINKKKFKGFEKRKKRLQNQKS